MCADPARLVLVDGVVHLDEEAAVFEAMLAGWERQPLATICRMCTFGADATDGPTWASYLGRWWTLVAEVPFEQWMRRAVETTRFDARSIDTARSKVRRRRRVAVAVGAALALAGATAITISMFDGGRSEGDDVVAAQGDEVHLMTQAEPGVAYPAALMGGTLVVTDAQCLAVQIPADPPFTYNVYWPHGYTAERDSAGRAVLYDADGQQVATEGDRVTIGGGLMPDGWGFPQPNHPCANGQVWGAAPDIVNDSAAG